MAKKKTHEEYVAEVAEINPDIEVVEKYVNNTTAILHRCKVYGYEWKAIPKKTLKDKGYPTIICNQIKRHKQYLKDVADSNPNVEVIGVYTGVDEKILHKCKICGNEFMKTPYYTIRRNQWCPVCSGKKIGSAPEYKNSIWASEYRFMFEKYLTEEQMKQSTYGSTKKIEFKCPDCGKVKLQSPNRFFL